MWTGGGSGLLRSMRRIDHHQPLDAGEPESPVGALPAGILRGAVEFDPARPVERYHLLQLDTSPVGRRRASSSACWLTLANP